jgi:hypothetical protein
MTKVTRRDLFRRAAQLAPALILPELILPKRKLFAIGWNPKVHVPKYWEVPATHPIHPYWTYDPPDFLDGRYKLENAYRRLCDDYWQIPYYDTQELKSVWGTMDDDGIKFGRYPSPWQGDGGECNFVDASDIQESTPR